MANRYFDPVLFALEKNVVILSARVVFNPSGKAVLDTNNSKGICAVNQESVMLTGGVVNSTTSIGTVSSFAGLFTGMTVTGTGVAGTNTISSMSAAGKSLTMVKQNIITGDEITLAATGGRYQFQLGQQAVTRLDTYNKLLYVHTSWDMSTSSAIGTATSLALAPQGPNAFVVKNNSSVKTVPPTAATSSTDASISLQFGSGAGTSFVAYSPQTGESVRLLFVFGNCTAP